MSEERLLLTNDDGVEAPGLAALRQAAAGRGALLVVAPRVCHSSCAHAVSHGRDIRVEPWGEGVYAVHGTPVDCVRLALHHLAPGSGWVVSGINAGGNLGVDIHQSGTAAAAREAAIQGWPAVAISHYIVRDRPIDWLRAERWARLVLDHVMGLPREPGTFWNVNLPNPEPGAREPLIVRCPVDPSPLPLSYRLEGELATYDANYHARRRLPGHDIAVCFGGDIALSRVRVHWDGD